MFVRCERCRAIYMLASDGAGTVVACTRCPHVFEAQALTRFSHGGTIGGAATPIETLRKWVPPPPRKVAPIARLTPAGTAPVKARKAAEKPSPSKVPLIAGAVVLVVLAVFAVLALRARHPATELSPAMKQALETAQKQLLSDDDVSLESAIAGFAALSAQAPQEASFVAKRALATALLGAALKAEANDLTAELARLEKQAFQVRDSDLPEKDATLAALQQAQADLRLRQGPAGERADKLLREAADLSRKAAEAEDVPEAYEAMAIAAGSRGEEDRVRVASTHLEPNDAWLASARASLKMQGIVTPGKAGEARAVLGPAAGAHPELLRLQVDLARATFYAKALDEAEGQFQAISRRNPAHAAAQRGLELVAAQRSPAP